MGLLEHLDYVYPEVRRRPPETGSGLCQEGGEQGELLHGRAQRGQTVPAARGALQSAAMSKGEIAT